MDPVLYLITAVVSTTASLALVFGGLAGWFVRRLDRRFDSIDRQFEAMDRRFQATDKRFEAIDNRFDAVDKRFDAIDRRFETIDRRFVTIDQRFAALDKRFEAIDRRFDAVDRRFEAVDRRFEALHQDMQRGFDEAREERARLSSRLDGLGQRIDVVSDHLADARQSLGRLEGVVLRTIEPEPLPAAQRG